ncbi:hypothetical protein F7734_31785 [Scytonema sp. UIC 10036]|uniref:hypothetical protein n=1 Tax=Scytonema sp. UIC 10036 TaxID=2304196 RepID=UPI0012DA724F|nr:hypothetical protein [Scytonema sp. UIC 10036]MUG96675.1 hypothetical protein [Scytonema sp. UIC 10036]
MINLTLNYAVTKTTSQKAETAKSQDKPTNWIAAGAIVTLWVLFGVLIVHDF